MRVAILSPFTFPIAEPFVGGTEAFIYRLATALRQRGVEVVCYACEGSNIPGIEIRSCGVSREALTPRQADYGLAAALRAFRTKKDTTVLPETLLQDTVIWTAFDDAYSDPSIDIIHNSSFSPIPLFLSKISQKPVLHTMHLPSDSSAMLHIVEVLRAFRKRDNLLHLVTGSHAHAQSWQSIHPVEQVIYYRLDTSTLPPPGATHEGRLAFIGRIDPTKGVEDAIAVAAALDKPLDIYGAPQPPMIPYFEAHVQPLLQKHANVTYHGLVTQETLQQSLRQAQALLFPIKWNEPFGYVAIEAMAMGAPVVMYDRGASQELIVEGLNGFVVPPDNLHEMAVAVKQTERIDRLDCAAHAREKFHVSISAQQYSQLYQLLIQTV